MLAASMFSVIKKKNRFLKYILTSKPRYEGLLVQSLIKKKKNKNKELIKQIVSVSIVYFLHVSYFYQ